jgi:non-specific serine/threonine protein kinase/serine/threonine-protein kinase
MKQNDGQSAIAHGARPSRGSAREGSPAKLRRRLEGDLDVIVLKTLRKEPQRRYVSVEQMAEDIRRHLDGLPVQAAPDSLNYRAGKFIRRNKAGAAATLLIMIAISGGVAATIREARIAAANQRRAESRFNDVRKLAGALMFEIHDSIASLPGATSARKLIVQRSLEYLDGLSRESAGDVSLQRELANAYERIGLVQGDPQGSNLGDIDGARESLAKALDIRLKIVQAAAAQGVSADPVADQIALTASYREMCAFHARYLSSIGTALEYCRQARNTAEALYKSDPRNLLVVTELAKADEATGTVYGQNSTSGNAGDSYAALENHQKALDLVGELSRAHPEDLNLSSWQGNLSILTADDLFEIGRVSQAIPLYQQATQAFEALTRQSNNSTYEDSLELAYQRMGDMLLVAGHFEQSLPYYRKQLKVTLTMVAADPKSMSFRINLIAARATNGHGLWRAGHVVEALASLRRGLEELAESKQNDARAKGLAMTLTLWTAGALEKKGESAEALHNYLQVEDYYRRICDSDPKDLEDCLYLAGVRDRIARIYTRNGKLEDARLEESSALQISEPSTAGPTPNLEALYTLVNVYYDMGETDAARAATSGAPKVLPQSQACGWYEKSHAALQRIPEWLPITPNEFDSRSPHEIDTRLALCHAPHRGTDVVPRTTAADQPLEGMLP